MTMALLQSVRNLTMFVPSIVSPFPVERMSRLTPMSAHADNIVNGIRLDFFASIHDPGEPVTSGFSRNFCNFCKK
jgi:hypothetical protein